MFGFIIKIFQKKHLEWLEKQTPVGAWKCVQAETTILLQFEGGPHEGIYRQVTQTAEKKTREFGHWSVYLNQLSLLIMAMEEKNQTEFGVDRQYEIRYVGPQSIKISGPNRPDWILNRTDETLPENFI